MNTPLVLVFGVVLTFLVVATFANVILSLSEVLP